MSMNMEKALAGLDIGTTGCKITVFRADGTLLGEAYREYPPCRIPGEIDPRTIRDSVFEVLKEVSSVCEELTAIGITSFGETAVLLDDHDEPVDNAILYTDGKGVEQCRRLESEFGGKKIASITGLKPNAMYTLPKLMWIRENAPEKWARVRKIFLIQDYITYILTGLDNIAYSLAARTMAFDINRLEFSSELLQQAGIDKDLFARPIPTGSVAGVVNSRLALQLGLPLGISIIAVGHDQIAAAVGTGVLEPGMAVDGTGTVECITPVYTGLPKNPEVMYNNHLAIVPFVTEGCFVSYAFSFCGGALLKWYRDTIGKEIADKLKKEGGNPYTYFDSLVRDEPSGLLVLPHFSGAATPYMNNHAKGAILGLTTSTSTTDIYKALMEGVTYEMRLNLECLADAGIEIKELRATGGGASSEKWLQIKADILGIPVTTMGVAQSGTLGSIILAGLTCRLYYSKEEACSKFLRTGKTFYPRKEKSLQYEALYQRYKKLYHVVGEVLDYD